MRTTNFTQPQYGLIFDFDGLIMDTEWPIYEAWLEIYQGMGHELSLHEWGICVGNGEVLFNPVEDLSLRTGKTLDELALRKQHLDLFYDKLKKKPMTGVLELIRQANDLGWKISCASSSPYKWVDSNMTDMGIRHHFEIIKTSDDVEKTKPDPALFVLAREAMQTKPEHTYVVEDSPHGLVAARASGAYAIAVPNRVTETLDLSQAQKRVKSLLEVNLMELVEERGKTAE